MLLHPTSFKMDIQTTFYTDVRVADLKLSNVYGTRPTVGPLLLHAMVSSYIIQRSLSSPTIAL